MANIFDQDFGQFPSGATNQDYASWIDPTGKGAAFANKPAGPRDDMFESFRSGAKPPAPPSNNADDMFESFRTPSAKPPAPKAVTPSSTSAAGPPVPGAQQGRDVNGKPAWFIPDEDRRGRYIQVTPPPTAGARWGRNAEGGHGWFVDDPNRPGKYAQVFFPSEQGLKPGQAIPAQSFAERSRAITQRAKLTPEGLPLAVGAGLAAPFVAPMLGQGVLGVGRTAGTLGKLWLGEKLLETFVPEQYQPQVIRAMRVLGEAH